MESDHEHSATPISPPTPTDVAAVIDAIQPDRIEHKVAVIRKLITQRLAVHEINGRTLEQLWHEFLQRLRIGTVPTAEPLQRDGSDDKPASAFRVG